MDITFALRDDIRKCAEFVLDACSGLYSAEIKATAQRVVNALDRELLYAVLEQEHARSQVRRELDEANH